MGREDAVSQKPSDETANPEEPSVENQHTDSGEPDQLDDSLPELDEGPRPGPVDEVQQAIFEAVQHGDDTDLEIDELPDPLPELDAGPRPAPVDEVQEAIFEAAREGAPTEVDFDRLPEPASARPKKVVKIKSKDPAATEPLPPAAPEPPPEPEPEPEPPPPPPEPAFTAPPLAPPVADFWLVLALFTTLRGLSLLLLRPGGFIRDWSDFDTFLGITALSDYGLYPFLDFWLEWPPLVPWLAVGAYKLSLLLPPWPDDPRLWFVLMLGGAFLLFEIGNLALVYRLARRLFSEATTISRVLWLYALLFPPLYAMLGFFDGVALFFILLGLDLLLGDRRFLSAVAVGAGFLVKIIPILLLPVAVRRLWQQYRQDRRAAAIEAGLYGVVFGLTVLVLLAPFLYGGPEWLLTSVRSMLNRSSWETVWAVLEGYHGFGVVLGDRLNPAETNFAVHAATLPWGLISLAFAGIYALFFFRPASYQRPRAIIALTGLTVSLFMLYNKGYSPQFLVYLLPFIVLLFPNGRGLTYALIYTGLNVLEQPVYFVLLPDTTWLLTAVVIARFLLTIIVTTDFALELFAAESEGLIALRQRTTTAVGVTAAIGGLVLLPLLAQAYTTEQLKDNPIGTFTGFMQAWTTQHPPEAANHLLLSEQTVYRRLYPHLHRDFTLSLSDGAAKFNGAPAPADLLTGLEQVWTLPTGEAAPVLRGVVDRRGTRQMSVEFAGLGTASLYSFKPNALPFLAPARFVGGIELLTHQVAVKNGTLEATLYWRAASPQSQSYTVFTQLLNAEGEQVAGHDSIPALGAAPTSGWAVNTVQADLHRIQLPADLPPGDYTLIVGLYNQFGERLRGIGPDGFGFANRAMPLTVVRLP